jgi:outer membrane protein assembly factor BamB
MNHDDILLLGLKQSVTAISKREGRTLWKTELPGSVAGDSFVTVLADDLFVFAHTEGRLHCLDLANGQILWSNELPGYGFGIASLCFPGGAAAPGPGAVWEKLREQRRASS